MTTTLDPAGLAKQAAAAYAVKHYVKSGMRIGLGSGSTAAFAVRALAVRIAAEGLALSSIISTSDETAALARSLGIAVEDDLTPLTSPLDVTIDGADEVDGELNVIKGGGGALLREKLVAVVTKREVIVVDPSKRVESIGQIHPLPIMIVPYAWQLTQTAIEQFCGREAPRRLLANGAAFVSNDGLYCLDIAVGRIADIAHWEQALKQITGVADVGLFVGLAHTVVIGYADGKITEYGDTTKTDQV